MHHLKKRTDPHIHPRSEGKREREKDVGREEEKKRDVGAHIVPFPALVHQRPIPAGTAAAAAGACSVHGRRSPSPRTTPAGSSPPQITAWPAAPRALLLLRRPRQLPMPQPRHSTAADAGGQATKRKRKKERKIKERWGLVVILRGEQLFFYFAKSTPRFWCFVPPNYIEPPSFFL